MITLYDDLKKIANDHPETRKHLVPLLRKAFAVGKTDGWTTFQMIPNHRKNLKNVLKMMEVLGTGSLMALRPSAPDYAKVAKKYAGGRNIKERGIQGKMTMKRGKLLFVGNVSGIGDIIIAHNDFPV